MTTNSVATTASFPLLFSPLEVGPVRLKNRAMLETCGWGREGRTFPSVV